MAFLLQARFNSSGPTNSDIINLGGVSFNHKSKLFNGNRCAFFEPSNDAAGLQIVGTTRNNIANHVGTDESQYTIYFKFCIDLRDRMSKEPIPILSFVSNITGMPMDWVCIEGNDHFSFYFNEDDHCQSRKCSWVFDNYWHTFTFCKGKHIAELFLDGINFTTMTFPETVPIKSTPAIYIGRKGDNNTTVDHYHTLDSGMLDDICIINSVVYTEHFIPPNNYFMGADIITNYHWSKEIDLAYMPRDLAEYTDKRMLSSVWQINETQKQWLPRRLRIQWHEEEYLWESKKYWKVSKSRDYTAISFWGLEQPLLMDPWNEENVDIFNCFYAYEEDKIYTFMLFLDYKFVKLSDIYIMKSGQYYTMFIKNRKPDKYNKRIQHMDLVFIPFKCIYEEDEPKRMDLDPIYTFKDGLFDPYHADVFYYIDPERSPDMNTAPIKDDDIPPSLLDDDGPLDDSRIVNSYWRYGKFEKVSQTSTTVTMRFVSSDNSFRPKAGDKVNLYRNKINMPEETYDIVGTDLFRFYYFDPYGNDGFFNKTISMQVITELKKQNTPPVLTGLTSMREETVYATEDHQTTFKIPEVYDDDKYVYNNFLVFRNSVCMNALNRFRVSYNRKYITFINPLEEIEKGDAITFVFLKTIMADQFGPLQIVPTYLHTYTGNDGVAVTNNTVSRIKIPPYRKMNYTNDNVMLFVDGTLITPDRYNVTNGYVVMKQNPPVQNTFYTGHEVTFVILTLASYVNGPGTRARVIKYQLKQGARFVVYDLMIDKKVKITLDNFVVFDREGRYMPSITGEVFNLNIIKYIKSTINPYEYIPRYLTCVWCAKRNLPNEANITRPDNTLFMKEYIRLYQEFYEIDIDFNLFMTDFNFRYNKNLHYGENLQRAFLYLVNYNQLEFLDFYKKHSKMQRLKLDVSKLNDRIRSTGIMGPVCMDRSLYKDPAHRSFSIFFQNGIIPKWYENITYEMNQMYLRFPKLFNANDDVEVFKFHDLNDIVIPLTSKIDSVTVPSS